MDSQGPPQFPTPRPVRLDSWKAIADYLGRDTRTVIRWEKERHLPVRRVPGGRARSVFAFADELDAWLASEHGAAEAEAAVSGTPLGRTPSPARRTAAIVLTVGVVIVGVIGVSWRLQRPVHAPARLALNGAGVEAFDAEGTLLWNYPLPGRSLQPLDANTSLIGDVDGDGSPEAVLALALAAPDETYTGRLVVLNADGTLRWERRLGDVLTFGTTDYGPPWLPNRVLVYRAVDGRARIAIAAHHFTWWPDIVATFDSSGRRLGRFVNAGWIYDLRASADRRHLLAAGVANTLGGSVLAVLDAEHIDGVSPEEEGAPACTNCPAGHPMMYLLVPWSDLASPAESPRTTVWVSPSGQIELRCPQVFDPRRITHPEAIIQLSSSFDVMSRRVSDAFWPHHAELEREGRLHHSAASCPWRTGPPVHTWTPEYGWVPALTY